MYLELENIGKIKNARIELRGITVLTGLNGTGKSTFGEALYCAFNAFYESEKLIEKKRKNNIERVIMRRRLPQFRLRAVSKIADDILGAAKNPDTIRRIIQDAVEKGVIALPRMDNTYPDTLAEELIYNINLSDDQLQQEIADQYLGAEFEDQITNVGHTATSLGKISLEIKGNRLDIGITDNKCFCYTDNVSIECKAFYIDTPFIIDEINSYNHYAQYSHRWNLLNPLKSKTSVKNDDIAEYENDDIVENVSVKQKMKDILSFIASIVPGRFVETAYGVRFQENGLPEPLAFSNISAGKKLFLVIKRLLECGELKKRYVLILDEPEIHLHPEWQIKFAEVLVLLQKEFNLTILLTTHSPYFLRTIEVFSIKEKITDRCNYYLTTEEEGFCSVKDVAEDTDSVYKTLAKPLQTLDNILYAD